MATQYKKIITPAEVIRNGETTTIKRINSAIRDHLWLLFGPLKPTGNITIEITTQLTDSAGSSLMTRRAGGAAGGPPNHGAGGEKRGAGNG